MAPMKYYLVINVESFHRILDAVQLDETLKLKVLWENGWDEDSSTSS